MRASNDIKKPNLQERLFEQISNGNYPASDVSKMSVNRLESFVLRLLEYTSVRAREKSKSSDKISISDKPVLKSYNKQDLKEFREVLKKVVIRCCDFFRSCQYQQLQYSWFNDENFGFLGQKGEKRKTRDVLERSVKKRKTLLPSNFKKFNTINNFEFSRYLPELPQEIPEKPPTKPEFFNLFQLESNKNNNNNNNNSNNTTQKTTTTTTIPDNNFRLLQTTSKSIRLQNCPTIPFSSDIGQMLLKKENQQQNFLTERKLERIEWYLNKEPTNRTTLAANLKFEVTFLPKDDASCHFYKFPKKQFYQTIGIDRNFDDFVKKICKPLQVRVKNENLLMKKRKIIFSKGERKSSRNLGKGQ